MFDIYFQATYDAISIHLQIAGCRSWKEAASLCSKSSKPWQQGLYQIYWIIKKKDGANFFLLREPTLNLENQRGLGDNQLDVTIPKTERDDQLDVTIP